MLIAWNEPEVVDYDLVKMKIVKEFPVKNSVNHLDYLKSRKIFICAEDDPDIQLIDTLSP